MQKKRYNNESHKKLNKLPRKAIVKMPYFLKYVLRLRHVSSLAQWTNTQVKYYVTGT